MRIVVIEDKKNESKEVITLRFRLDKSYMPGQFVMVWIPGVDEIPMSLSYVKKPHGITVHVKGDATEKLASTEIGHKIGLRGPYGNSYPLMSGRALIIAGGTGIASLAPLAECLSENGTEICAIIGAKSSDLLIFVERMKRCCDELIIATDDGSKGYHGDAYTCSLDYMDTCDVIYACGPEIMLKKICEESIKRGIKTYVSTERYMKCGVGICGSCALGRLLVCRDGPVFSASNLLKINDFGKFKRSASGKKEEIC